MTKIREEIKWSRWYEEHEDIMPILGAYVQVDILHLETAEDRRVQGVVSEVSDEGDLSVVPKHVSPDEDWGWVRWRGRVVEMRQEVEHEHRELIDG